MIFDDEFFDPDDEAPIAGRLRGEPIPDLRAVARDDWFGALFALSPLTRREALRLVGVHDQSPEVAALMHQLWLHDADRRHRAGRPDPALGRGTAVPAPAIDRGQPAPRRWRQVSIRLAPADHAALLEAADWLGLKPGRLARMLVHNGVKRITYERRRDEGS